MPRARSFLSKIEWNDTGKGRHKLPKSLIPEIEKVVIHMLPNGGVHANKAEKRKRTRKHVDERPY